MKKLKVGIFGFGPRGQSFVKSLLLLNCDIVAICEKRPAQLDEVKKLIGKEVKCYTSFDDFIEEDLDAVLLTNYFHEHAPYAIKCFKRNIHVFSECISNGTMAEGVMLARAFEKTKSIYFLAENYPQMKFNLEMQRVAKGGTLGKILYAEGEYIHPVAPVNADFNKTYKYSKDHWRHYLPRTYYVTHSLGPIMRATGATPKKVSAFNAYHPFPSDTPTASMVADRVAIMTTLNDDGSVFKFVGCGGLGAHGNTYRLCGEKGQIENLRGMGEKIMLRYNDWEIPEGKEEINFYEPSWNDKDEEFIVASGHGGADYITLRLFVECVRNNTQPPHPFDLHSAISMSSVAILAHRIVLNGGGAIDIPDFRKEEDCRRYENDYDSPFIRYDGQAPTIPCCSNPDYRPTQKQIDNFLKTLE